MTIYHALQTNLDLWSTARAWKLKLNGIYARNRMPKVLHQGAYILNLDTSRGPGTHWTCFYIERNEAVYFDPFGVVPPQELVVALKGYKTIYNTMDIQALDTGGCGYYCLLFLWWMSRHRFASLSDRLKAFQHLWHHHVSLNLPELKYWIEDIPTLLKD